MTYATISDHLNGMMNALDTYRRRIIVIKIGGNSIAQDKNFLSKIARQIHFLAKNDVAVVLVHGGGPQIDSALEARKIKTLKGEDGRRITSPAAMRIVAQVMTHMNQMAVTALVDAGCAKSAIVCPATLPKLSVTAKSLDAKDPLGNRSGFPLKTAASPLIHALKAGKIVVLHSLGIGRDGKTLYNINGDDYAMAIAAALKAERLILITNVAGVLDRKGERIPVIDPRMAQMLIAEGTISGGMVPKVESALAVIKQGVGGVSIIDGSLPWAIMAELLAHQSLGTFFASRTS